ncbi:MAG: hypothetical protein NTV34_00295 [Proteobacteria bacterium]|nr:hypothetical protein [Pseudomonadota bacterium]
MLNQTEGRKKQPNEAFLWLKESVFTAAKAKELGIVDELAYAPNVDFEDGSNELIDDYAADQVPAAGLFGKGYSLTPERGLALIEAAGEIVGASEDGHAITPGMMQEELEWARTNKDVAAVVLRVSSPGGSASASDDCIVWIGGGLGRILYFSGCPQNRRRSDHYNGVYWCDWDDPKLRTFQG